MKSRIFFHKVSPAWCFVLMHTCSLSPTCGILQLLNRQVILIESNISYKFDSYHLYLKGYHFRFSLQHDLQDLDLLPSHLIIQQILCDSLTASIVIYWDIGTCSDLNVIYLTCTP